MGSNESNTWNVICGNDNESGLRVYHLSYNLNTGGALARDSRGRYWQRIHNDGHLDSVKRGTYVWIEATVRVELGTVDVSPSSKMEGTTVAYDKGG